MQKKYPHFIGFFSWFAVVVICYLKKEYDIALVAAFLCGIAFWRIVNA